MKKVIEMTNIEARQYFLKSSSFFNMALPEYFDFTKILSDVDKNISYKPLNQFWNNIPSNFDNINYKFRHNKDGKYAWRTFQIMHPATYINLVNLITDSNNWNQIISRFSDYKANPNIICCSDIVESTSKVKDQGASINNWWSNVEQKSIDLALKYKWIGITDITDCYGSIYTHSIAWALHSIPVAKAKKNDKSLLGNQLDVGIRYMTYNQTNGIPQGSTLMDFIAEMVLGFGDILLSEKLNEEKISDYTILRYRDDYRVFSNSESTLNKILKIISEELSKLNFKMNTKKTFTSSDVITSSIKADKLASLLLNIDDKYSVQKQLLIIRSFSIEYQNSGSLKRLLSDLYKSKIEKLKVKPKDNYELISIIVDIMYNNPSLYQITTILLSKLLYFEDVSEREKIIKDIEEKFKDLPNTDYLSIWLQRITIIYDKNRFFNSVICNKIYDNSNLLWNSSWLNTTINENLIIDSNIISTLAPVVSGETLDLFDNYN